MPKLTLFDLLWGSLAIGLAGMLLGSRVAHWFRGRRLRHRAVRARAGELAATSLLQRYGYRVVAEQLSGSCGIWIDGVWQPVTVRADYLAVRRGRHFVVEVKTGQSAPNPANTATRRQLLEYDRVFDADGLILADMERRQLRRIEFAGPNRSQRRIWRWRWALAGGLIVGFCAGRHFQPPLPAACPVECAADFLSD